jgi:hypothetical protein
MKEKDFPTIVSALVSEDINEVKDALRLVTQLLAQSFEVVEQLQEEAKEGCELF